MPTGYSVGVQGRREKVDLGLRRLMGKDRVLDETDSSWESWSIVSLSPPLPSRLTHFHVQSKRDVITKDVFIPLDYRRCFYDIAPKRRAFGPTMEPSLLALDIPIYAKKHSLVAESHRQRGAPTTGECRECIYSPCLECFDKETGTTSNFIHTAQSMHDCANRWATLVVRLARTGLLTCLVGAGVAIVVNQQ